MSTVDRISTDATAPSLCSRQSHEAAKLNADTFAAATRFVGVWLDGMTLATCRTCGSSLSVDPSEWDDEEETLPMNPCVARLPR